MRAARRHIRRTERAARRSLPQLVAHAAPVITPDTGVAAPTDKSLCRRRRRRRRRCGSVRVDVPLWAARSDAGDVPNGRVSRQRRRGQRRARFFFGRPLSEVGPATVCSPICFYPPAQRGGCFQRRLFVCQFVCLFVRTITSERLNVG